MSDFEKTRNDLLPAVGRGELMRLGTPRSETGQTVEVSYGWTGGEYFRLILDRSDNSYQWYVADDASTIRLAESSYDAGGANFPPRAMWTPCAPPEDDEYAS